MIEISNKEGPQKRFKICNKNNHEENDYYYREGHNVTSARGMVTSKTIAI